MNTRAHRWVIVLAAGEGSRLQAFTTHEIGRPIPKQFFALRGRRSMLRETLERAERLVPSERIVTIVAAQHREWWEDELCDYPPDNVLIQPENRGTAAGVLLPLLVIHARDPEAEVVIMPSDHFVDRDEVLTTAVEEALLDATEVEDRIVLLGVTPEEADPDYGWILPEPSSRSGALSRVAAFVEKPDARTAQRLMRSGALINAFLIAARSRSLLRLYRRQPRLLKALASIVRRLATGALEGEALSWQYGSLEKLDFSRDLLQASQAGGLWVLRIPPCGWSDLGTPERVLACLDRNEAPIFKGRLRARYTGGSSWAAYDGRISA